MRPITFFMLLCAVLMSFGSYAQDDREDVVYLKNGSIYRGTLIEQIPNVSYKIEIAGGTVISVTAAEVEKITKEKKVTTNESNDYRDRYDRYDRYVKPRPEFKYREKGYFFQGELMAGFFEGGTWIVNGYKFNAHAALGFGFGIEGVGSDVHINNDQNYAGMYIPLFAYLSGDILRKKITPFYQAQAGYTFWPTATDPLGVLGGNQGTTTSQKGGFMGGAGFGCRFYKSSGFNVSLSGNVNIKNPTLSNTTTYYDYYGNAYNVTTHTSPWLVLPVFMFGLGF